MRRMGIGLGVGINRSNYAQGIFNAYSARVVADGGVVESGSCVDAVSSLLQSASLLLIPSGYKGGKLYAEIPTNGNGDLTWTRGGTANRTNSSGNIELMGANVPRLSYMYGSCPSALLEPQRTNLALWSDDFSNVWWSKSATVTSNTTISPSGNQDADTFTDSSTNYQDVFTPSINITANATYTVSVFIKKTTGALTHYPGIGILLGGGVSRSDFGILNTTTGQIVRDSSSNVNSATYSTQSVNDYWRVVLTFTDNQSNNSLGFRLYPAISSNGTNVSSSAQGSNVFWGSQIELGAYVSTIIPTTSATATRVADSFSRSNIYTNGLISASGGTWFVELRGNVSYTRDTFTLTPLIIGDNATSPNNGLMLRNSGGSSMRLEIRKLIAGSTTLLYTTLTDTIKIAFKWNGSSVDVFVNGTKQVSASFFATTNMDFLVGSGVDVPKFIQQMALFPTPLSDTDCTTLTTL